MDCDPSSFSLTVFRPLQPSAVVVPPKHSGARLSLGPGRLANHLLTEGGRHLIEIIGYVGDKLGYGPAHPVRQIVDAFSKHEDARLSLLDDVYDKVRGGTPKDLASMHGLEESCCRLAEYTLP
jgi:hypothetical protein